jgi:uncharacterized membrane protein
MLALFIYLAGVGATMLPLYRSWNSPNVQTQVYAFQEAGRNQAGILLPGIILVGVTGLLWAIRSDYVDPVETGWLLTVEGLYLVAFFVLLPGMAAGLRRARLLALQAEKSGEISEALKETLEDRGPIALGTVMLVLIVVMAALAVTQPY